MPPQTGQRRGEYQQFTNATTAPQYPPPNERAAENVGRQQQDWTSGGLHAAGDTSWPLNQARMYRECFRIDNVVFTGDVLIKNPIKFLNNFERFFMSEMYSGDKMLPAFVSAMGEKARQWVELCEFDTYDAARSRFLSKCWSSKIQ